MLHRNHASTRAAGVIALMLASILRAGAQGAPAMQTPQAEPPVATAGAAEDAAPAEVAEDDDYTVDGFIDTYYSWNTNNPGGIVDPVRVFDGTSASPRVSLVQVHVEETADDDNFGFGVKLQAGLPANDNTATLIHSVSPSAIDRQFPWVQEAWVRYNTSHSKGAYLDFGKFNTHMGYEVIESRANMNYSRSILFGWAIPFYHFGLRYTYPFDDHFSAGAYLVNGWNNVVDNNTAKSVGLQAIYKRDQWTAVANWIGGDEGTGFRNVVDAYVTYATKDGDYDFALNADYGRDPNNGAAGTWWGVAAYARRNWDHDSLALRGEVFRDPQGFMMGVGNNTLYEVTGTYEHRFGHSLSARAEYRGDFANTAFFPLNAAARQARSQHTFTIGTVAYWK